MNSAQKKTKHGLRSIQRRKTFRNIKVFSKTYMLALIRVCNEAVAVTKYAPRDAIRGYSFTSFTGRFKGSQIYFEDFNIEKITKAEFETYREFGMPMINPSQQQEFILDSVLKKYHFTVRVYNTKAQYNPSYISLTSVESITV